MNGHGHGPNHHPAPSADLETHEAHGGHAPGTRQGGAHTAGHGGGHDHGQMIADFGKAVEGQIAETRQLLPEDLVISRVSDQPQQVAENVDLFMSSLYEAIVLVVLVALIGFWEWRSALLMALCIPITLAMTFGLMRLVGMDIQQISIGALIISLGLLIDDPVVAGDAIKRDIARGVPRAIAAWLAPTRLATAILFATITNIVAYLPFLTLTGDTGRRHIRHLDCHASAAVAVFIKADEAGAANLRIGQGFPGDNVVGNILGNAGLKLNRGSCRSGYLPGGDILPDGDLLDMVHEEREILEVAPELINLIDRRKDVYGLLYFDPVLRGAQPQQGAGIPIGYPAGS